MEPVSMGAAGLMAASGLLGGILQSQAQKELARRQEAFAREQAQQAALNQAFQQRTAIAGQAGDREQSALNQLLGVIARTVR